MIHKYRYEKTRKWWEKEEMVVEVVVGEREEEEEEEERRRRRRRKGREKHQSDSRSDRQTDIHDRQKMMRRYSGE